MDRGWGTFRTTDGNVSVGDDVPRLQKTPRKFLRGQLSYWRHGNRRQQATAALRVVGFLLVPLSVINRLYTISELSAELAVLLSLAIVALNVVFFWAQHLRETEIPLSTIEDVTLDAGTRKLTITHDAESRLSVLGGDGGQRWFASDDPLSVFEKGTTKTELTLRTADDVRKARTVLRTRGVAEFDESEPATETVYRYDTKRGAVFCERCNSQVSPADRTCPACDYALRIEQPVATDSREFLTEFE